MLVVLLYNRLRMLWITVESIYNFTNKEFIINVNAP